MRASMSFGSLKYPGAECGTPCSLIASNAQWFGEEEKCLPIVKGKDDSE